MNNFLSPDPSSLHPLPPAKHENDTQNKSLDFLIQSLTWQTLKDLKQMFTLHLTIWQSEKFEIHNEKCKNANVKAKKFNSGGKKLPLKVKPNVMFFGRNGLP